MASIKTRQRISHAEISTIDLFSGEVQGEQEKTLLAKKVHAESAFKRLGILRIVALISSVVALLAATGFISWIWWSNPTGEAWRRLIISKYGIRAITITAVVIRVAISGQAAITASMMASIILEHRNGVVLEKAAAVSLARFEATPRSLITFIRGPGADHIPPYFQILIFSLIFTSIGSQFSSTFLLSDLSLGRVTSFPENSSVRANFRDIYDSLTISLQTVNVNDPIKLTPTVFESFAEYSEGYNNSLRQQGVDDTGVTVRAFIPISSQNRRQELAEYEGIARVFDARVICFRPETRNVRIYEDSQKKENPFSTSPLRIAGEIRPERSDLIADLVVRTNDSQLRDVAPSSFVSFDCPLLIGYAVDSVGLEICAAVVDHWKQNAFGVIPLVDPLHNNVKTSYSMETLGMRSGDPYIIWETKIIRSATTNMTKYQPYFNTTLALSATNGDEQWLYQTGTTAAKDGYTTANITLAMSLCVDAFMPSDNPVNDVKIKATALLNRTEPILGYTLGDRPFDTRAVRTQLGATQASMSSSADARGILGLSLDSLRHEIQAAKVGDLGLPDPATRGLADFLISHLGDSLGLYTPINVVVSSEPNLNSWLPKEGSTNVGLALSSIFNDTLVETGSLARALQAFKTTLVRIIYYGAINSFNSPPATVSTVMFVEKNIPTYTAGYWSVISIITVHLTVIIIIVITFMTTTTYSRIGDAWMAVAQVKGNQEMEEVLEFARLTSDRSVRAKINEGTSPLDGDKPRYRRVRVAEGGRMVII